MSVFHITLMTWCYCRDIRGAELMNEISSMSVYVYSVYEQTHVLLYLFIFTVYIVDNNCRIYAPCVSPPNKIC